MQIKEKLLNFLLPLCSLNQFMFDSSKGRLKISHIAKESFSYYFMEFTFTETDEKEVKRHKNREESSISKNRINE